MESKSVNIKVDLTSDDVYKFQKSYIFNAIPKIILVFMSFSLLTFIAISIISIINGNYSTEKLGKLIAGIIIVLIILVVIPISLKKTAANTLQTNKLLQRTQEYTISSEGFNASSESVQAYIKWNEMYTATETRDSFQFFIAKGQAYIIPKRYLSNNEDIEIIREAVKKVPVPKHKNMLLWGLFIYIVIFIIMLVVITLYNH